jgi:hypothetical protein
MSSSFKCRFLSFPSSRRAPPPATIPSKQARLAPPSPPALARAFLPPLPINTVRTIPPGGKMTLRPEDTRKLIQQGTGHHPQVPRSTAPVNVDARPPASDVPKIFRQWWFLNRNHLVANVLSAQCNNAGHFTWV